MQNNEYIEEKKSKSIYDELKGIEQDDAILDEMDKKHPSLYASLYNFYSLNKDNKLTIENAVDILNNSTDKLTNEEIKRYTKLINQQFVNTYCGLIEKNNNAIEFIDNVLKNPNSYTNKELEEIPGFKELNKGTTSEKLTVLKIKSIKGNDKYLNLLKDSKKYFDSINSEEKKNTKSKSELEVLEEKLTSKYLQLSKDLAYKISLSTGYKASELKKLYKLVDDSKYSLTASDKKAYKMLISENYKKAASTALADNDKVISDAQNLLDNLSSMKDSNIESLNELNPANYFDDKKAVDKLYDVVKNEISKGRKPSFLDIRVDGKNMTKDEYFNQYHKMQENSLKDKLNELIDEYNKEKDDINKELDSLDGVDLEALNEENDLQKENEKHIEQFDQASWLRNYCEKKASVLGYNPATKSMEKRGRTTQMGFDDMKSLLNCLNATNKYFRDAAINGCFVKNAVMASHNKLDEGFARSYLTQRDGIFDKVGIFKDYLMENLDNRPVKEVIAEAIEAIKSQEVSSWDEKTHNKDKFNDIGMLYEALKEIDSEYAASCNEMFNKGLNSVAISNFRVDKRGLRDEYNHQQEIYKKISIDYKAYAREKEEIKNENKAEIKESEIENLLGNDLADFSGDLDDIINDEDKQEKTASINATIIDKSEPEIVAGGTRALISETVIKKDVESGEQEAEQEAINEAKREMEFEKNQDKVKNIRKMA